MNRAIVLGLSICLALLAVSSLAHPAGRIGLSSEAYVTQLAVRNPQLVSWSYGGNDIHGWLKMHLKDPVTYHAITDNGHNANNVEFLFVNHFSRIYPGAVIENPDNSTVAPYGTVTNSTAVGWRRGGYAKIDHDFITQILNISVVPAERVSVYTSSYNYLALSRGIVTGFSVSISVPWSSRAMMAFGDNHPYQIVATEGWIDSSIPMSVTESTPYAGMATKNVMRGHRVLSPYSASPTTLFAKPAPLYVGGEFTIDSFESRYIAIGDASIRTGARFAYPQSNSTYPGFAGLDIQGELVWGVTPVPSMHSALVSGYVMDAVGNPNNLFFLFDASVTSQSADFDD